MKFPVEIPASTIAADETVLEPRQYEDIYAYRKFSIEKVKEYAMRINHHLEIFELSATTGEGMDHWIDWLKIQIGRN